MFKMLRERKSTNLKRKEGFSCSGFRWSFKGYQDDDEVMMRLTTTQTGQIPIGANINFLALKLARGDVMTPTTVSIGYNVKF